MHRLTLIANGELCKPSGSPLARSGSYPKTHRCKGGYPNAHPTLPQHSLLLTPTLTLGYPKTHATRPQSSLFEAIFLGFLRVCGPLNLENKYRCISRRYLALLSQHRQITERAADHLERERCHCRSMSPAPNSTELTRFLLLGLDQYGLGVAGQQTLPARARSRLRQQGLCAFSEAHSSNSLSIAQSCCCRFSSAQCRLSDVSPKSWPTALSLSSHSRNSIPCETAPAIPIAVPNRDRRIGIDGSALRR